MTARSSKERSAKAAARRRERGEVILRLPTLEGTRQQLDELILTCSPEHHPARHLCLMHSPGGR